MVTVYDVPADKLIAVAAEDLKKNEAIQAPPWAAFVKTGAHKERPPEDPDWWFGRAASVLRKVYLEGPIGTRHLKKQYGGKRNLGSRPGRVSPGGGNITRKALQQLETAGYIQKASIGKKVLGRRITASGQKFLDSAAYRVSKAG